MEYGMGKDTKYIFLLGIGVLCAWMVVIIICASPQLFRNYIYKHLCCCFRNRERIRNQEKIKAAQDRVRSASKSFLSNQVASFPSTILLQQVMGTTSGILQNTSIEKNQIEKLENTQTKINIDLENVFCEENAKEKV
ncbi:Hypothetical protein SRAE_X000066800 [Strongyloides ratti]|uniref:Uncharacterized protein n=1 Tax=Strongyloides ratti TaxID=34506 RepID=A0A090LNL2_STRRB|nr:Hypothetical protein SRAE_X000066800 [Strongyloides ratti]CEF71341.1 Hypothetical protein SRAE_X000066800 [Strongyloides ratti]